MLVTPEELIRLALCIPLLTIIGIYFARPWPNAREGFTLAGSILLFITIASLTPQILNGERPSMQLVEF